MHFLSFLKIFGGGGWGGGGGVKGQKMVRNDKKVSLSGSISQEPYIMIVIFGTHV